jgi:ribosomal protein S18 acetylase RimI-like enzyme
MDIEFRNLLPTESKVYRKIRLESLQKFPNSFSATYKEALKTEKLGLENDIENQTFEKFVYGAFSDNELIGICAFVKNKMNIGTIYQMYVQQNFQGRNIGLRLVEEVIKEARIRYECSEIFLEVASDNYKAYNLYKKIGFEEVNEKENNKCFLMKYNVTT